MKSAILFTVVLALSGDATRKAFPSQACPENKPRPATPESRAIAFLAREVPAWSQKNHCFSCHNNGDAARTLFIAGKRGIRFDRAALGTTTEWLQHPHRWGSNGRSNEFAGPTLAAIQFGAALSAAVQSERLDDPGPLVEAARIIASFQEQDGSWKKVGPPGFVGSPVSYGSFLATAESMRVLQAADADEFSKQITRAESWLTTTPPKTVLDAGALLLGIGRKGSPAAASQKSRALKLIEEGRDNSGGWGPYVVSHPEAFDTAIVLLGLTSLESENGQAATIREGRRFLVGRQLPDGSWQETTRPAGGESYAQRISTTAWATQALMATRFVEK